jgi:hypothetical protein
MANLDIPNGFTPSPLRRSRPYEVLASYATAIYPGDLVHVEATGGGLNIAAAQEAYMSGVCLDYSAASTASYAAVADDPQQDHIAQDDGSGTPTQANILSSCDHLATAGDSTLKVSKMELAISTVADSVAGHTLLQFIKGPDYAIGVNSVWRSIINEHMFHTGKTTTD